MSLTYASFAATLNVCVLWKSQNSLYFLWLAWWVRMVSDGQCLEQRVLELCGLHVLPDVIQEVQQNGGRGARGRPMKIWSAYVREDLDAIEHACDWWMKCKDRKDWKEIIQVLLDVSSP